MKASHCIHVKFDMIYHPYTTAYVHLCKEVRKHKQLWESLLYLYLRWILIRAVKLRVRCINERSLLH